LSLAEELRLLAQQVPEHAITLGELMTTLGARVTALLIMICALPFCSPITIPGLSTPFGLVIAVLAGRYAAGHAPWLPQRLQRVVLPPKTLAKVLAAGGKVIGWIEVRMKARWLWVVDAHWKLRLHAIVIVLAALVMTVPLPPFPPLTNTLPALTIVLLTMSTLEKDGIGILAGHSLFLGTLIYFAFWGAVIWEGFHRVADKFGF